MKNIISKICFAAIALIGMIGCAEEVNPNAESDKVTLTLSIGAPLEGNVGTKALGEWNDSYFPTNKLFLAVYESGYLCEVVEATNITKQSTNKYSYKVSLTKSDNPRNIHFVTSPAITAASFFPFEETSLGSEKFTTGNNEAYWGLKTASEITSDTAKLVGEIGNVDLVRNFAKLTLTDNADNFTLISYKVFNVPDKGFVAPYDSEFKTIYSSKDTYDLAKAYYDIRMPESANLLTFNSESSFITISSGNADYFYERPTPKDNPAFIIIKGTYSDGNNYFYKINLRNAAGEYYALFRNFHYKVELESVQTKGYATIAEAIESAGSGDVLTSIEYEELTNISDAVGQMFVSETSYTVISATEIEVKYKFIPNVTNPNTTKNTVVTGDGNLGVQIIWDSNATNPSIVSVTPGTSDGTDGYRSVIVKTTTPGGMYKEQSITFKGCYRDSKGNYKYVPRTVKIIVRPTLTLNVECPAKVNATKGTSVPVTVGLENNLPESIFPIDLKIQVNALSLVPTEGAGIIVKDGKTFDGTSKPTFYYVKTVTYADYESASAKDFEINGNTISMKQIVCDFKSNTEDSTSDIYVTSDLFNVANCHFDARVPQKFNASITSSMVLGNDKKATLTFDAVEPGTEVTITLENATINGQSTYTYTPAVTKAATNNSIDINLTYGKSYKATLSAEGYTSQTVSGDRTFTIDKGFRTIFGGLNPTSTDSITINIGLTSTSKELGTLTLTVSSYSRTPTIRIDNKSADVVLKITNSEIAGADTKIYFWTGKNSNKKVATVTASTLAAGVTNTLDF